MIHNTHYNLIDTLIFAFGMEKWKEICAIVVPAVRERIGQDSILIPIKGVYFHEIWFAFDKLNAENKYSVVNEIRSDIDKGESFFANYNQAIKFTIIECILFAMTEGRIYGKEVCGID